LSLGGALNVSLINNFTPAPGQAFDILDWGSRSGTFASINLPMLSGLAWNTSQLYTSGMISVGLAGDFNNNGSVDAADYVVWRKGLGTTYTQADYDVWRAHFGQTIGSGTGATGSASAGTAVPESSSLFLLLAAANAGLIYRARPFRLWRTLCEHDGAIAEASTFLRCSRRIPEDRREALGVSIHFVRILP
jgi:hypothetical protein